MIDINYFANRAAAAKQASRVNAIEMKTVWTASLPVVCAVLAAAAGVAVLRSKTGALRLR
jgi:hypothetical protein